MIKTVMIVGQKWLATEVFRLCQSLDLRVIAAAAPSLDDRLAIQAITYHVPVTCAPKKLLAEEVPEGIDLLICAHAHCFITEGARNKTKLGAIGYHPSLLPRHRGRDAVRWAIHMGEQITGGTVYWLNNKADAGEIAAQDWCWVRPDDTPDILWRRELAPMGLKLFERVLNDLISGQLVKIRQDESLMTFEPSFHTKTMKDA